MIIFTVTWNDYFMPLIFLSSIDQMTLPVGIMSLRDPVGNSSATSEVIAAVALAILPVLLVFLFAQRWIVDSFVRSGDWIVPGLIGEVFRDRFVAFENATRLLKGADRSWLREATARIG